MDRPELYYDDIYAWSEQQADRLRRLARSRPDLPGDLDLEHVAEEIEDVGESQRDAAESFIRLVFVHLLKLAAAPDAVPARHRRSEIVAFHNELLTKLTPAMRQRIPLDVVWQRAVREAGAALQAEAILDPRATRVLAWAERQTDCPVAFDALLAEDFSADAALADWRPAA